MSVSEIFQGERNLFGAVGANAALGGAEAAVHRSQDFLSPFMPCLSNMLTLVQLAVGLATLFYLILKITKVLHKKRSTLKRKRYEPYE